MHLGFKYVARGYLGMQIGARSSISWATLCTHTHAHAQTADLNSLVMASLSSLLLVIYV